VRLAQQTPELDGSPVAVAGGTARRLVVLAVYASALLQGFTLVVFPAAGPILTDPDRQGLSSGQFGLVFIPQIVVAIVASASASRLAGRLGSKRALAVGLAADVAALVTLALTTSLHGSGAVALVMVGTALAGAGFGIVVSILTTYAIDLFPARADAAVTGLHVVSGVGQVAAPLAVAASLSAGAWWLAPAAVAGLVVTMLVFQASLDLRLPDDSMAHCPTMGRRFPASVLGFVVLGVLYGVLEGTFGAWTPILLEQDRGLSSAQAGMALAIFWASVTAGRILFAVIRAMDSADPSTGKHVSADRGQLAGRGTRTIFVAAPGLGAAALVGLPQIDRAGPAFLVVALGGLGVSFLFPYTVSLAAHRHPDLVTVVSGSMVAALMVGIGVGTAGAGTVRGSIGLEVVFRSAAIVALVMAALAWRLTRPTVSGRRATRNTPYTGQELHSPARLPERVMP
jgi:MFS family permease